MYQNNTKSATTAGLLGIFLGNFGAHWWYLGVKKKALMHVGLIGGAALLFVISGIVTAAMASSISGLYAGLSGGFSIAAILSGVAELMVSGNSIWALIEAIMIMSKGDAGLAAMGISTAAPAQPYAGGYGQAPQQPYAQPAQGYGQPMQDQAMPQGQPMQGQPAPYEQGVNNVAGVGVNQAAPVAPQPQAPAQPMDPAKKNG